MKKQLVSAWYHCQQWWNKATQPFPRVTGQTSRLKARTLTTIILAIVLILAFTLPIRLAFFPADERNFQTFITVGILSFGVLGYLLSRMGIIAPVIIGLTVLNNFATILAQIGSINPFSTLYFATIPIVLIGGFFRIRITILWTVIQLAFLIVCAQLFPQLDLNSVLTGPFTFMLILSSTVIMVQFQQKNLQNYLNQQTAESDQRYRIAAEGSLDPYYILENIYDHDGKVIDFAIVDLNSRAEQQLKTSREKALGTRFLPYFPELENVRMIERYRQVIETGKTLVEDFELPLNDGTSEWYHHQVVRVANGLAVTNREITNQKQQAFELENRINQLIGLNELARTITSTIDLNEVYWLIFEYFGQKMFSAQHMVIGIYNEQEQTISCAFRVNESKRADPKEFPDIPIGNGPASQTVLTRQPRTISSHEYYSMYPDSVFKRGEKPIHSLMFLPLIVNDQSLGYISIQHEDDNAFVNVDMPLMMTVASQAAIAIENARLFQQAQEQINIQQESETALRQSRAQYQLLAETARDMILTHDIDGNLLYANQAFLKLTGCTQAEITQYNIHEFFPETDNLLWLQDRFKYAVASGEKQIPHTVEADMHLPNEVLPMEINPAVIHDEQGFQGMLLIARDITDRRLTEQALINSEANFRSLAEFSPDVIYIFQLPEYNLLYFNRVTFLGHPADELYEYNSLLPYVHPDDYDRIIEYREDIVKRQTNAVVDFEFRLRDADDYWQWVQSREVIMERNQQGDPTRVMVSFTVITTRKEAEFELRRSEERLRAVINTQTEVISRYSIDLKLTFVNDAYKRAFGLEDVPMEEIIGRQIKDYIPEEQHAYIDDYHHKLVSTLEPAESVHKTFASDGSERWYRWKDQPILDNDGNLIEFQSVGIDITEQREAEQALHRSDEIFRLITENIEDIFYVFDIRESRITYISPTVESSWGVTVESIYGDPYSYISVVHPDDKEKVLKLTTSTRESGQSTNMDYRIIRPDNTVRWVQVRDFVIDDDDGKAMQIVGIIKDITEERRMNARLLEFAREQERMKMLKQFVGDTTHDLMTPLSVIKTSLYLLNKAHDDTNRIKRTTVINEQIDTLVEMIGDMLDMSRLDEPVTANYDFEPTEINEFLETIVEYHRALALQSAHHIEVDLSPNLSLIHCDRKKLQRAITNLISNALKYTPHGSQITIKTYEKAGGIGITISDNGDGIPEESIPHVFERFYRVEQHRPQGSNRSGTGLGLAITKSIIDGHGGTVDIQSKVGEGTTFNIWLPLQIDLNKL